MPLVQGYSDSSIAKNVAIEIESGKSKKQALAIALSVAKRNAKKKKSKLHKSYKSKSTGKK